MTALSHKSKPNIWGKITYPVNGWKVHESDRPTLFADEMTIEQLRSLCLDDLKEFELVEVEVIRV